jgi:N-acetylglucosaminyl-diphospho-decaprenol L-rhamnosyltransferase
MSAQSSHERVKARAAVIVVTYNSKAHFPRQRAALEAQTYRDFALVVWDNGSRADQRPAAADFPDGAIVIQSEDNIGFAAGNNRAAELIEADFIVLLNPDAFPEPDWLEKLVSAAEARPKTGSVGSTQIMCDEPTRYDGLGDCYHAAGVPWRGAFGWLVTEISPSTRTFSACAAAALYRSEAWTAAGGFDESYFASCEDVDLGFRLRLLGWDVQQAEEAIVHHIGGASSGKKSGFAIYYGTRNRLWTFVKCMPLPLIILLSPAHLAVNLAFLLVSPFRGTGVATWRGVIHAILGIGRVLKARRLIQNQRIATLKSLCAAMSWNPFHILSRAPRQAP